MTPHEIQELAERVAAVVVARLADRSHEKFMDGDSAAKLLGCSKATIERRTQDGTIPSHKIGGLRRYLASELLKTKGGSDV